MFQICQGKQSKSDLAHNWVKAITAKSMPNPHPRLWSAGDSHNQSGTTIKRYRGQEKSKLGFTASSPRCSTL